MIGAQQQIPGMTPEDTEKSLNGNMEPLKEVTKGPCMENTKDPLKAVTNRPSMKNKTDPLKEGTKGNLKENKDFLKQSTPSTKRTIYKNLIIVSLGFFLNFTAYSGTANLQSSINNEDNLGTKALTSVSTSGIVSNLFLATLVISKLGPKWTMIVTLFLRTAFTVANFHSAWYTLYFGGIIAGLAVGPLWNANTIYLTNLGMQYAEITSEPVDAVIAKFFGFFFMIHRCSHLMGNFISSLVLQRPKHVKYLPQDIVGRVCASRYCYENLDEIFQLSILSTDSDGITNGEYLESFNETMSLVNSTKTLFYHPSSYQRNLLFGLYTVCSVLAPPLLILISSCNTSNKMINEGDGSYEVLKKVLATFRHMKTCKAILIMPLSLYCGLTYCFILTSFSLAFVTCALGIDNIGYVMVAFGAAAAIAAIICGPMVQYIGRRAIFLFAACATVASLIGMQQWTPASPHATIYLYVFSGIWGACNAIWLSQLTAFIGFLFQNNNSASTAYACHNMWQMAGHSIWQSISVYLCIYVQLYLIIALLTIGMLGYLTVEVMVKREEQCKTEYVNTKL